MGELRGSYRVQFVLALALCGADLLCMASTWLPGGPTAPKWLVMGLCVAVLPVFVLALIRSFTSGSGALLFGRANANSLIRYVLLLPPALKLTYGLVVCLVAVGMATGAGAARDVRTDAAGHYYTEWDRTAHPQHSTRVGLTESEYDEALRGQLRIFSAGPAVFYAVGSFLVLAAASAAASRAKPRKPGR